MKRIILGLSLIVALTSYAQTGGKNFIDQNYIEITGKAEMEVTPDLIYLQIILNEKEYKSKQGLDDIEAKMMNKLTEIGVDIKKDLSIMDFTSNFKSQLFSKDVVLSKHFQLILHDTKTLQSVFLEFQKLGISNITIEKTEHSKIEQLRKEVKVKAIKAAKEKAELLASALNQNIGKALYIQEADNFNPNLVSNVFYRNPAVLKSKNQDTQLMYEDIEFEKIKIESTILVRFELL